MGTLPNPVREIFKRTTNGDGVVLIPRGRTQGTGLTSKMEGTIFVTGGTWGSGTLKLQVYSGIGWVDVTGVTLMADGMINFSVYGAKLKLVLSGATNPNLTAVLASDQLFATE